MKTQETLSPPVALRRPQITSIHGYERVDDYFWLRDRDDPAVIAYLEAENAYTDAMTAHTKEFQETVYKELLGRIKETDESAPFPYDDYFYYERTVEGLQYPIYCRKQHSVEEPEEVLLDVNALAVGHEYFRLGSSSPSPNHRLLAFSSDTSGAEDFLLTFKDLQSGQMLPDEIPHTHGFSSVAWAHDNETVFYTINDDTKRPYKVLRHTLGTDVSKDVEIFHEPDEAFYLGLSRTTSRKYLMLASESNTTSEVRVLRAGDPEGTFRVVEPRRHMVEYSVAHQEGRFLIRVNDDEAKNFRLVEAPEESPGAENWKVIIPHQEETKLERVLAFKDYITIFERTDGLNQIRIITNRGDEHYVQFPDPVYTVHPGPNAQYDTSVLRFHYTSLIRPDSAFDYDMATREMTLIKQQEVLGGYEPADYVTERIFATAPDGVKVPISIVYKKDFVQDGSRPLWLYGYGSYGYSADPFFSSLRLSLIDRGFAWAIAHIRGGGDLGERWKEDGKLLKKRNTFTDFIACAEHLISEKYTSANKLVIHGGSAGGLLMGAVTNLRPDLFKIVVAQVPFVDCVNTILDPNLPLSITEWEEWGNPQDPEIYDYMMTYSPYDNVEKKEYPIMLVTAGLNDPRVSYWEPAKWAAKLRAMKTDNKLLLLKTQMGAGHAGPSGRYDYLREEAFKFAFVLDEMARSGSLLEGEYKWGNSSD